MCVPCLDGYYSGTRASECTPCAAGTYRLSSFLSGDCSLCDAGTYAPLEQASACLDCPRGYYTEGGGADSCSPCPAGSAGASAAGGVQADACTVCSAGEFSIEDGSIECKQCPAGTASGVVGADNEGVCGVRVGGCTDLGA